MTKQGILEIKARHIHMAVATSTSAWRCATCRSAGVYSMPIVFNVCDGADHAGQCFLQAVCPKCHKEAFLEWAEDMTGIIPPLHEIESILNDPKRPVWIVPTYSQLANGAPATFEPANPGKSGFATMLGSIKDRVQAIMKSKQKSYDPFEED